MFDHVTIRIGDRAASERDPDGNNIEVVTHQRDG